MKHTMQNTTTTVAAPKKGTEGRAKRVRIARRRKAVDVAAYLAIEEGADTTTLATKSVEADSMTPLSLSGEAQREETLQLYVEAAWRFAKAVLWKGVSQEDTEVRRILGEIEDHIRKAADNAEAYITIIGSVMASEVARRRCPVLTPFSWLIGLRVNPYDPASYGAMVKKHPTFEGVVRILATHYLEYTKQPSAKIFQSCNEALEAKGGKTWMRIFYE